MKKVQISALTRRAENLRPTGVVLTAPDGERQDVTAEVSATGALTFTIPNDSALYVYQPSPIGSGSCLKLKSAPASKGQTFPVYL